MHRGQVDRLPVAVRELINPLLDAFERRVAELEQADASTQVRAVHRRRRWGLTPSALGAHTQPAALACAEDVPGRAAGAPQAGGLHGIRDAREQ